MFSRKYFRSFQKINISDRQLFEREASLGYPKVNTLALRSTGYGVPCFDLQKEHGNEIFQIRTYFVQSEHVK